MKDSVSEPRGDACLEEVGARVPRLGAGFSVKLLGRFHPEERAGRERGMSRPPRAVHVVPHVSELGGMLGAWGHDAPPPTSEAVRGGFCRWRALLEAATSVPFVTDAALGREQLDRSSVWGFLDWLHAQRGTSTRALVVVSHAAFMQSLFRELGPFHGRILNGQIYALLATWPGDRHALRVYFVRHCVSCSNVLRQRRDGSGRRPTLCADLEHVYAAARCIGSVEATRRRPGELRVCSSPLPRALLTAAALVAGLRGQRLDAEKLLELTRDANGDPELGPTCCSVGRDDDAAALRLDAPGSELDEYAASKGLLALRRRTFEASVFRADEQRRGTRRAADRRPQGEVARPTA